LDKSLDESDKDKGEEVEFSLEEIGELQSTSVLLEVIEQVETIREMLQPIRERD
jgi:hypothetical protein